MIRRRSALDALEAILSRGVYANLYFKEALRGADARHAAFVQALVYTTLEHLYLIDYYLDAAAKGRLQKKIRNILRLGVCEILYLRTEPGIACNEYVQLCKAAGKAPLRGYVNGVLRNIARMAGNGALPALPDDAPQRLSLLYGYPLYLVREYIQAYGLSFTEAMLSCRKSGMTLRAQAPYRSQDLEESLRAEGRAFRRGSLDGDAFHLDRGFAVETHPLFTEGKIAVQGEGAMFACRVLEPGAGETILDACAAPGGKSAYMSALSGGKARIFAWDIHEHRSALLRAAMRRLHVCNVECVCRDASVFSRTFEDAFDKVLLDVPCSGFGILDKPDIRYGKSDADIDALAKIQAAILDCGARYVKPGGVLVYATCTISQRENEAQIRAFLQAHPHFRPLGFAALLPPSLREQEKEGMLQLFPHLHGCEGFFIARMERKA